MNYPRIAIIYLSYNPRPYLDRVIKSVTKTTYKKEKLEFIVVDNPHKEFGSAKEFLEEKLLPLSGKELPKVTIIENKENLGFTKGNNVGIQYAIDNGYDYIFLHNQDGFMGLDMLERVINIFKMEPNAGVVQPMVMLYPEVLKINTSGNKYHFLGFGYCGDYKKDLQDFRIPSGRQGAQSSGIKINYATGAAMMVKTSLFKKYGSLDESLEMYHEDLEFGLRLKSYGFDSFTVPSAKFYHEYEYSRNENKYYLMERNRWMILLMYYKWRTLIILLPVFIVVEVGLIIYSFIGGWYKQKFKAIGYWMLIKNWRMVLQKRKITQKNKIISDKELLKLATAEIQFEDINNFVLKYIGNPLMKVYFWVVKRLIIW